MQFRQRAATIDADQITTSSAAALAERYSGSVDAETGGVVLPGYSPSGDDLVVPLGWWLWSEFGAVMVASDEEFTARYDEVPDGPRLRDRVALVEITASDARDAAAAATSAATGAKEQVDSLTAKLRSLGIRV